MTDSSARYGVQQRLIRVQPCATCTSFQRLDVRTSAKARACTGLRSLRSGAPHRLPHSVRPIERARGGGDERESDLERHVAGAEEQAAARDRVPGAAAAALVVRRCVPMRCPICKRGVLVAMTGPFGDFLRCSRRGCGFTELTGVGGRRPWS
jgi:hypothetical protein